MATQCRAKDPNSCRVHGSGGKLAELQATADAAAVSGNITLYLETREEMETLTDEDPTAEKTETFIAPNTGNLIVGNWLDEDGDVVPEAPNDMLLANLYQSSFQHMPHSDQVEDLLRARGYNDNDVFLAKYFSFKKEDDEYHYREVGAIDVRRALTAAQNEIDIVPATGQVDNFLNRKLGSMNYGVDLNKSEAQNLVKDWKEVLMDSYQ